MQAEAADSNTTNASMAFNVESINLLHVSLQQYPKMQYMIFHTKTDMQYTFSAHLCQSVFNLATLVCLSWAAWWESSDLSHQAQHVPTCHLSDARISTLLDPVTSLHCLSSYCICHNYITGRRVSMRTCECRYVCECRCVCERKLKKLPVPVLIPSSTVFSNYRLVHKLLLELVVEHLQASPSLKMNIANGSFKEQNISWEYIMLTGNTMCLSFIIQAGKLTVR